MERLVISATGHRPNKLGGYGNEAYNRLVKFAEKVGKPIDNLWSRLEPLL